MADRHEGGPGLDRRQLLGGAAVLAVGAGTPLAIWLRLREGEAGEATDRQRNLLAEVVQLVIPRTDTPGAADVGTHDFVILALSHGLDGTRSPIAGESVPGTIRYYRRQDGSLDHLGWLEAMLDLRARGDFLAAPPALRLEALADIDDASFAEGAPDSPWKKLKALILTGYYTSEAGGARELRFELVPGRWDPNLRLDPSDRAWSSDLTAVEFG